ncbi:MAG: hypothetical protein RML38_06735, partial [Bacteroidia bacterium]|nr:hypothetical protein [Bacteroidia bacterium]
MAKHTLIILVLILANVRFSLSQEQPSIADKVIIRLPDDPLNLNPLLNTTTVLDNNITKYYIFQSMVELNPITLQYEPVLITQIPNFSADKKVYE